MLPVGREIGRISIDGIEVLYSVRILVGALLNQIDSNKADYMVQKKANGVRNRVRKYTIIDPNMPRYATLRYL